MEDYETRRTFFFTQELFNTLNTKLYLQLQTSVQKKWFTVRRSSRSSYSVKRIIPLNSSTKIGNNSATFTKFLFDEQDYFILLYLKP